MTCFVLPTADLWLLGVLNSPLLWTYLWRNTVHGKDEALRLKKQYMKPLPIAQPSEEIRNEAEPAVEKQIELTKQNQQVTGEILDWLKVEFGIDKPGQKLEAFSLLSSDEFVNEVKKRKPKESSRLSPSALSELRTTFTEFSEPMRQRNSSILALEHRLSELVNEAYELTPEEIDLLWKTAPPRMPITPSDR